MVIIAVGGCGPTRDRFVGHWQGRSPLANPSDVPEDLRNTAERVNLILEADGDYAMVWMGLPITGSWSGSASEIRLEPKSVMERSIDKLGEGMAQFGQVIRLRADGEELVSSDFGPKPTRFKRIQP